MSEIPRGKYVGEAAKPVENEADHFMQCPACGGWLDCRDLARCSIITGRCRIPKQDRPQ